jgi:hypothetical protein
MGWVDPTDPLHHVKQMAHGVCKLTGNSGIYVKSHLLPKALTRRSNPNGHFITGGPGRRPKKSWSSWYDEELVIRKGEDILERYDNWAIRELRRLELVWSGWSVKTSLPVETWFGPKPQGFGLRQVECSNPDKLRLFFLSLLWRAAATSLPDFDDIQLESEDLERLRTMVLTGDPRPLEFYPISLFQLVSKGHSHNLGPVAREWVTKYEGEDIRVSSLRFYFDGLIAHIHRKASFDSKFGPLHVGASQTLYVQAGMWEQSFQLANIRQHHLEARAWWPKEYCSLMGLPFSAATREQLHFQPPQAGQYSRRG